MRTLHEQQHHTKIVRKIFILTIMMMWPWSFPLFGYVSYFFFLLLFCHISHLEEYGNQNKWQDNKNYRRFAWLNNEQHSFGSWRIHFNRMFLFFGSLCFFFFSLSVALSVGLFIYFQQIFFLLKDANRKPDVMGLCVWISF